jgi:glucose-6-phosphate 1-dehydrogenase
MTEKEAGKNPPAGKPDLKLCDIPIDEYKHESFVIVLFGAAGDYTKRMLMPSLYHLFCDKVLQGDFSVLGYGLPAMKEEEYRTYIREALNVYSPIRILEDEWNRFSAHLFYISADFSSDDGFSRLNALINDKCPPAGSRKKEVIFYFAVPPVAAPEIVRQMQRYHLCSEGIEPRLVMEKPFGRDRASAARLNETILQVFKENQVYRVDHYLGKEPVQNIIFLRFTNSIFEGLWGRDYIDHVEITVAEQLGVEHRGAFYEETGVVRDVVQNHLMHLLAVIAMEPPARFEADLIRDERVKVIKAIRHMDDGYISRFMVRGQYGPGKIAGKPVRGYREEDMVSPASPAATFFAAKMYIDNPRWSGVPFFIRTGKRLEKKITEIIVHFKKSSLDVFQEACEGMSHNNLRLGVQPDEHISLGISVKCPGTGNQPYPVTMDFRYEEAFPFERHTAHERIILDCLKNDLMLFARQDGVEALWDVVDPINRLWERTPPEFPNYPSGSWGPPEAEALIRSEGYSWGSV